MLKYEIKRRSCCHEKVKPNSRWKFYLESTVRSWSYHFPQSPVVYLLRISLAERISKITVTNQFPIRPQNAHFLPGLTRESFILRETAMKSLSLFQSIEAGTGFNTIGAKIKLTCQCLGKRGGIQSLFAWVPMNFINKLTGLSRVRVELFFRKMESLQMRHV